MKDSELNGNKPSSNLMCSFSGPSKSHTYLVQQIFNLSELIPWFNVNVIDSCFLPERNHTTNFGESHTGTMPLVDHGYFNSWLRCLQYLFHMSLIIAEISVYGMLLSIHRIHYPVCSLTMHIFRSLHNPVEHIWSLLSVTSVPMYAWSNSRMMCHFGCQDLVASYGGVYQRSDKPCSSSGFSSSLESLDGVSWNFML